MPVVVPPGGTPARELPAETQLDAGGVHDLPAGAAPAPRGRAVPEDDGGAPRHAGVPAREAHGADGQAGAGGACVRAALSGGGGASAWGAAATAVAAPVAGKAVVHRDSRLHGAAWGRDAETRVGWDTGMM